MKNTIYILEDNPVISKVLLRLLDKSGYACTVFERGDEALKAVNDTPPALIICDIMVPGTSGLEVARHIKSSAALSDTKVVILTAVANEETRNDAMAFGVDKFVTKNKLVLATFVKEVAAMIG